MQRIFTQARGADWRFSDVVSGHLGPGLIRSENREQATQGGEMIATWTN
jgi:hypothetical protein